jgi:hypothetical protein
LGTFGEGSARGPIKFRDQKPPKTHRFACSGSLAARQRQTARIAYAALALGCLFLAGWIWHALSSPLTATRIASALYFLPFCAVCFLLAFYNALLNFQIRSGRLASWREYLRTPDDFWPT